MGADAAVDTAAGAAADRPPVTRELARFVADYPAERVGERAATEVSRAVLDLLGVMVAGSAEPAARLMVDYAVGQGAVGDIPVLGAGVRLAPAMAALANGTAGHALDYDDIGLQAGHVSTAIVPAALAMAEHTGASGRDTVAALALGYEVTNRLTRLYPSNLAGPYRHGYHKPSVYSVFGATAAAGRLAGLDAAGLATAFGIAASQAGGLRVNFGTMTKPMHAGNANRTAVEAVTLAGLGFTASDMALEGRYGWFDALCRGEGRLDAVLADQDGPLAIEQGMTYKAYPCCGANHYAIDGVLWLMSEAGLRGDQVDRVEVDIHGPYLDDVLIYPWPRSGLEGKFCLPFTVAAAMVDGAVTVRTFTDDTVRRLTPSRPKVRVHADPGLAPDVVRVRIHTADGRLLAHEHTTLRGSLEQPLSWAELADKFAENCAGLVGAGSVADAVAGVEKLVTLDSVRPITELLLGERPG
jgi:2-methylcitrate dehydratase PrpD